MRSSIVRKGQRQLITVKARGADFSETHLKNDIHAARLGVCMATIRRWS